MLKVQDSYLYGNGLVTSDHILVGEDSQIKTVINKQTIVGEFEREMSRRKQHKPRHLDSEETGSLELDSKIQQEKTPENLLESEKGNAVTSQQSSQPEEQQQPSLNKSDTSFSPENMFHKKNDIAHQGFFNPTMQSQYTGEPKRAVVSPIPRSLPAESYISQPLRASGPRYYPGFSTQQLPNDTVTTKEPLSEEEDEDVPSDMDSCANESELQDEIDQQGHDNDSFSEKYRQRYSTPEKVTDEDKTDQAHDDDESGIEENTSDLASSTGGTVKLKALETTNVAVAQVVENEAQNDPESTAPNNNLPNLQQVLFTLHQQQMFQLQVLQQIQNQIAKLSQVDEDGVVTAGPNGVIKENPAVAAAAAAVYGMNWLGSGLASSLHQQRSDEACVDDMSENSLLSSEDEQQQQQQMDGSNEDEVDVQDEENSRSDGPKNRPEVVTPNGSADPDNSPRSTPAKTSISEGEDIDEPFHHSTPNGRPFPPPLPYLGGLGHFMPGVSNPSSLLPSNMFSPHMMHASMPGRFPIFRPPVMPRSDEEDHLEEFMEIDTSDSTKLEEFMKKMEPTLKDPNQCAICKKVLSCKSALQMHYRTHTGSRPFKCKICGRAFTTKGNLKTHMSVHRSRHSSLSLHQCPVCSKKFNSMLHVQEHMRVHIGEMNGSNFMKPPSGLPMMPQGLLPGMNYPLLPPALPKERQQNGDIFNMPRPNDIDVPKSIASEFSSQVKRPPVDSVEELRQKRQKTELHESKFENNYLVSPPLQPKDEHDKNLHHSDDNQFSTSLQALEESVKEMDKKMTSTSSNFFLKTEICPPISGTGEYKTSELSPGADSYRDIHKESVKTSVITQAPQRNTGSPNNHSSQNQSNQQSPPSCPTSPFSAGRRQSLRHVCSVCHKPFSSSSALQIHMRTHTGERPFKCTVCDKAFTTKGNLKVHMSTHAVIQGPPRRGRRMSMDTLPPFSGPPQFPPVAPRPPLPMFPGFHYPSLMNNMFMHHSKGLPPFLPSMNMPGFPLLSPRKDDVGDKRESSLSPTDIKDYHKEAKENNNIPSKGMHGELDLSTRGPAIKT